ncbi:MAG: hypothetical protein LBO66_10380 [Deltaproteobacteria bacterium]|nr:hypothetical protein [Deltaproteobacteria bacterium]
MGVDLILSASIQFLRYKNFREKEVNVSGKIVTLASPRPGGEIVSDASVPTAVSPRSE